MIQNLHNQGWKILILCKETLETTMRISIEKNLERFNGIQIVGLC